MPSPCPRLHAQLPLTTLTLVGRPVPVPFAGTNLVSLSHVEDLACMMAAAVGNPNAIGQAFNLTSDTPLTHAGIAQCIGKLAGKEVKVRPTRMT